MRAVISAESRENDIASMLKGQARRAYALGYWMMGIGFCGLLGTIYFWGPLISIVVEADSVNFHVLSYAKVFLSLNSILFSFLEGVRNFQRGRLLEDRLMRWLILRDHRSLLSAEDFLQLLELGVAQRVDAATQQNAQLNLFPLNIREIKQKQAESFSRKRAYCLLGAALFGVSVLYLWGPIAALESSIVGAYIGLFTYLHFVSQVNVRRATQ